MDKSKAVQVLERAAGGPLTFGRMIRSIREGEDLSLADFAEQLNVSRTNLSDIEHGRRTVSVARAMEWATKLGYHPQQFVALTLQADIDKAGLLGYEVRLAKLEPPPARPRKRSNRSTRAA